MSPLPGSSPLLAQASREPVRLVTEGGAGVVEDPFNWPLIGLFSVLAAVSIGAAAWIWTRGLDRGSLSERTFRALARRLGLSAEVRRSVRALARGLPGTPPIALLISEHALREAIEARREGGGADDGDLETVARALLSTPA